MMILSTRVEIAGAAAMYGMTFEISGSEMDPDSLCIVWQRGEGIVETRVSAGVLDAPDPGGQTALSWVMYVNERLKAQEETRDAVR